MSVNENTQQGTSIWSHLWVPKDYVIEIKSGETRSYKLNIFQRFFLFLENPESCFLASLYAQGMIGIILINVIVYIVRTSPETMTYPLTCSNPACNNNTDLCPGYQICAPLPSNNLGIMNEISEYLFTVDYGLRFLLVPFVPTRLTEVASPTWDDAEAKAAKREKRQPRPEPEYSWYIQLVLHTFSVVGIIDMLAIFPYYVGLVVGLKVSTTSWLRALRLTRTFKILRYASDPLEIVKNTLSESREVLFILAFFFSICLIVCACVIYECEHGEFMVDDFTLAAGYPQGAFVRISKDNMGRSISPFNSIGSSMYWSLVTMLTVGFGDVYPVTRAGRVVTGFAAMLGIFVIALPVSVIGNNFGREYAKYHAKPQRKTAKKMQFLKNSLHQHFSRSFLFRSFSKVSFKDDDDSEMEGGGKGADMSLRSQAEAVNSAAKAAALATGYVDELEEKSSQASSGVIVKATDDDKIQSTSRSKPKIIVERVSPVTLQVASGTAFETDVADGEIGPATATSKMMKFILSEEFSRDKMIDIAYDEINFEEFRDGVKALCIEHAELKGAHRRLSQILGGLSQR